MDGTYSIELSVKPEDTDSQGRLKLSRLLACMQIASGGHSDALGLTHEALKEKHLFWAVFRHRVLIDRLPEAGEEIRLRTWPMPTTRVAFPRAVEAYDAQGKKLFSSVSIWVLMDDRTRAMVLPGKSGVVVNGTLRGCELDVPKSILPKDLPESQYRTVTYSLLDINGHMNNTRYLDWLDDLLSAEYHASHTLQEFTICYLSEAREGQNICLHHSLSENILQVDARRERTDVDGKVDRVFSAQVQFS